MSKEIHYRLVSQREERHVIPGAQVSLHGEPDGGTTNTSFTATPSSSADQSTTSQRRARSRTARKGRSTRTTDKHHSARRIVGQASAASSNTATPGEADRSRHSSGRSRQQHSRTASSRFSTSHDRIDVSKPHHSFDDAAPQCAFHKTHSVWRIRTRQCMQSSIYYTAPRGRKRTEQAETRQRTNESTRRTNSTSSSSDDDQTPVRSNSRGRKRSRQPKRGHHKKRSSSSSTASSTHSVTQNPTRRPASRGRSRTRTAQAHRERPPSRGRRYSQRPKRRQRKSRSSSGTSTNSGTATHSLSRSRGRVSTARSSSRSRLPRHVSANRTQNGRTLTSATNESSDQSSVHRDRSASRGRKRGRSKRGHHERRPSSNVSTASSTRTETTHISPYRSRSRTSTARLPSSSRLHRVGALNLTGASSRPTPMTAASAWSRATSEPSSAQSVHDRPASSRQNKAVRHLFQSDRHASANASFQPTPFRPLAQSTPYVKTASSGLNRPTSGPAIPPRPTSAPPIPPRPAVASHSDPQASASTGQKDWHLESVTCEVDGVDVVNRPQSKIIKVRSSTSLVLRSPSDEGRSRKGPQRDRSRGTTVSTAKSPASHHPVANYRPPRRYHNGNPDSLPRYVPPNPNDPRRSAMSRVYYKYFAGLRPSPPVRNKAVPIHGFMADADPQDEPLARNRDSRRLSFTNLPGSMSTPSQKHGHGPGRGSFAPFRPASAPPLESRSKSPANSGAPTRPRYVPPNPSDPRRSAMSRVYNNYFAGLRPTSPGASGYSQDFNPLTDTVPPIHMNVSGSFFDPSRLPSSGWSEYTASPAIQPASVPSADSWDLSALNARFNARNTTRQLSFGDYVPSSYSASRLTSTSRPHGFAAADYYVDPHEQPLAGSRAVRLSFTDGDYVPSSYSASRLTSTSRPHGFAAADYFADPHEQPRAGSRAVRRLSFTDFRASPGPSNQQHGSDPRRSTYDPLRPASAPPLESFARPPARSGMRPTRPRYVPPNPNDPRRSAMSRVYRNYFDGLRPEPTPPNEALTLHGFIADSDPEDVPKAGSRARSAPPPETRPRSTSKSGNRPTRPRYVPPNPNDPRRSAMSRVYYKYFAGLRPTSSVPNEALTLHGFMPDADPQDALQAGNRAASPSETRSKSPANSGIRPTRPRYVPPNPNDPRRSAMSRVYLNQLQARQPQQLNHDEHSVSSSQALGRTMSRLSLEGNRCVLDGPAMAYSNLKIQVDRKKNTTVLISRLVLNAVDRTKSTTKLTTRTRELPGTVVSTCEKSKQRNDGQAKTEQNIQIEKDKIVVERKTRLKDLQAGSDYTLEDTGTCRNVCQMRMAFGRSTTDGALNVASGVLISKDATGCVVVREMTRLYIGDTKENTSALVPLVSTVEVTPSKDCASLPPFFDENVQVGRSTIEIAREVRLDPQLIDSLNGRTTDSGFEEQRVYTPYEGKSDVHGLRLCLCLGPTNITPVSSAASFNASRRSVVSDPTQRSCSDQSVASSIHEHPYHGLAPRLSDGGSRRRSSSDAQREMVASIPGVARSDTTRGTPELSSDSLSDSPASARPPGQGRSRRSKSSHATSQEQQRSLYYSSDLQTSAGPSRHHSQTNDSVTSKQSEGSKYLDVQLQTAAPSALHASSPHIGTAVAKSCHSVSERTALAARSAPSVTHSDKSEEQHSDRGSVSTAVSPSAHNATVRSTYAASPASSQFVSPQPVQPLPSRTGNGTHLLYHTFNLPDVYLPNAASQIHEHRRVIQLQMVSNGEPLTVDLHATFRTRQPVLTLNLTDVSLGSKRLWQK